MSEITYNLLVVDDDERIRNLLSQYLIKEGFIVSTASGAEEARKKTQLIKFDLIILDIMMPGDDGLTLTKELRDNSDTEVLFQSLVYFGIEKTLEIIDGMFAFVFYEGKSNTLWLVRDPLGEKPLYYINENSRTYVGWQWKANGGTKTSFSESGNNPAGTHQANTTAGFSIVTHVGTGSAGTIAHGLSASPEWILTKGLDQGHAWITAHKSKTFSKSSFTSNLVNFCKYFPIYFKFFRNTF